MNSYHPTAYAYFKTNQSHLQHHQGQLETMFSLFVDSFIINRNGRHHAPLFSASPTGRFRYCPEVPPQEYPQRPRSEADVTTLIPRFLRLSTDLTALLNQQLDQLFRAICSRVDTQLQRWMVDLAQLYLPPSHTPMPTPPSLLPLHDDCTPLTNTKPSEVHTPIPHTPPSPIHSKTDSSSGPSSNVSVMPSTSETPDPTPSRTEIHTTTTTTTSTKLLTDLMDSLSPSPPRHYTLTNPTLPPLPQSHHHTPSTFTTTSPSPT